MEGLGACKTTGLSTPVSARRGVNQRKGGICWAMCLSVESMVLAGLAYRSTTRARTMDRSAVPMRFGVILWCTQ